MHLKKIAKKLLKLSHFLTQVLEWVLLRDPLRWELKTRERLESRDYKVRYEPPSYHQYDGSYWYIRFKVLLTYRILHF